MTATYDKIASTTLGSAASDITFTSISGTYTDIVMVGTWSVTTGSAALYAQIGNGSVDTGSNYSYTLLRGDGSSAASSRQSNVTVLVLDSVSASGLANSITSLQNYSNTTTNKTLLTRQNNSGSNVGAYVNLWRSTAAINTIKVFPSASTFIAGTIFTLYGIKAE
jgi:hypothetical protein